MKDKKEMVGKDSQPSPHLIVEKVSKNFGAVEALKNVNFEVKIGEVMGLVGDNGAGKSTLLKIIAGAAKSDNGRFFLDGTEINISSPQDSSDLGISVVYQDLALCENLNVASNLFLGNEPVYGGWFKILPYFIRPMNSLVMEQKTIEAIEKLKVQTLGSVLTKVSNLSGGQRQAIAIARATRVNSTVVLLDEPTAALGVAQTREVLDVIKQLRNTGHAIVYISHNLRDVFEVCDRITVLRHGQNVAIFEATKSSPEEIVSAMTLGENDA